MAPITQANRPLRINTPLGADALLLERFVGEERISALFRFQLTLLSESHEVSATDILGKQVTVEIDFGEETRHITGIISRFSQTGDVVRTADGNRLTRYRAEMVPPLWLTSLAQRSRIFQEKSVPDILKVVLTGIDHELMLSATREPRNYCVQYRETDFAFASRLMEDEGIFYYHDHTVKPPKLVLADLSGQAPACPGLGTVIPDGSAQAGAEPYAWAYSLERERAVVAGKYVLWDHHFELPNQNLEGTHDAQNGDAKLEVYDYPGGYTYFDGVSRSGGDQAGDLQKIFTENQRFATNRSKAGESEETVLRGDSDCPLLVAGHKFTLAEHLNSEFDGDYLLTSVRHDARIENYETGPRAPFSYRSAFQATPIDRPYLPPRTTRKAVVEGAQTAIVVGPSGEEIYTDKYGRVMVQFHWDRDGKKDAQSSCWIRVSTPWAGKNWGMVSIPRIGSEVVVDFLEGDPDQPIITGMVYNAAFMPPYALPDNRTQTGIKTRSTLQGSTDTFNELRFEDKKDSEEIYFHAEKDLNTIVENNETHKVGATKKDKGDQTVEVFNNQTLTVGKGEGDAADGSQTVSIYKDQTVTLKTGKQTTTIEKGDQILTIKTGHQTETIETGNRAVTIKTGNDDLKIETGNQSTAVKMGNVQLELDMGNLTTKVKLGKIAEEAMQGIELKVGQNSIKIDQTGITIKGLMIKIEGQVQTSIKGLMTEVKADAMLQMKGAITMIN